MVMGGERLEHAGRVLTPPVSSCNGPPHTLLAAPCLTSCPVSFWRGPKHPLIASFAIPSDVSYTLLLSVSPSHGSPLRAFGCWPVARGIAALAIAGWIPLEKSNGWEQLCSRFHNCLCS